MAAAATNTALLSHPRQNRYPNLDVISITVPKDRYFADQPVLLLIDRCSNTKQLKQIHAQMLRTGLLNDPYSASKFIQACVSSAVSSLVYAQKVFDEIPQRNVYSWNAIIRAYASSPEPAKSLEIFVGMLYSGDQMPDKFTYPFVIKAATHLSALAIGQALHGMALKSSFGTDVFILNSLIHFYSTCGCLHMANRVFLNIPIRDIVSWNSMVTGFVQGDCSDKALSLFCRMRAENVDPDYVTAVTALSACVKNLDLVFGKCIHSYIEKKLISNFLILDNALLDMYTKCSSINDARRLFDRMENKDIISWTTMVDGYAKSGNFEAAKSVFNAMPNQDIAAWNALIIAYEKAGNPREALATFNELQLKKRPKPDLVTLVGALSACAQLGAVELGGWIHVYIKKKKIGLNCHLATSLIDMYSKCGELEKAWEVFQSVKDKDAFVWSSMIAGFSMHGKGREAIDLFKKMEGSNVVPNAVTFTNVLCGCSHAGLVEEGQSIFNQMKSVYGIEPGAKHYAAMVDILGRAGKLDEAESFIENMHLSPGASVWGALLGACRLHGNLELAEKACSHLLELEPMNHGAYVLLSNIYAKSGKWDEVSMLRKTMRDHGLKKEPGCSSIEVDGTVHEFRVGDNSHQNSREIYSKLDEIADKLKLAGYVPNKAHLLQLVEEDVQEHALYLHSEKLAIAFGLLFVSPSQPIRIMKNLRVCGDCHCFAKIVSEVYDREILLRDRYRFHHFKRGNCSCRDYW